jgi:hypothetical protein
MTAEQFTYWLQGFMEINDPETLGVRETQIIKDHLKLVFDKQTPDRKQLLTENPITTPYPGIIYPDPNIYTSPYKITCTDGEGHNIQMNDPNKKYCSSTLHSFSPLDPEQIKIMVDKGKNKFGGGIKC